MESVNKMLDFVNNNKILSSVLGLFLVLYAAMAAPKLPKSVAKIFDNTLFKLGFMFMIGYLATKDPSTAIISAAALMITLQTLSSYEATENFSSNLKSKRHDSKSPESESDSDSEPEEKKKKSKSPDSESPKSVTIVLSPNRADFVNECMKKADAHYNASKKATSEGKNGLAQAHQEEAIKQEIKAEGAVKAKQHTVLAEKAAAKGKNEKAESHKREAVNQIVKVEALVKADAHKLAAEVAKKQGNLKDVNDHLKQAVNQEAKAEALIRAETHKKAAEQAKKQGDTKTAKDHMKQADKEEAKAKNLIKADEHKEKAVRALAEGRPQEAKKLEEVAKKLEMKVLPNTNKNVVQEKSVPMPESPKNFAKVNSDSPQSPQTPVSESETPKNKPTINNLLVGGYTGGNYASF